MIVVDQYKQALNMLTHPDTGKPMGFVGALIYYWEATAIPAVIFAIETALIGGLIGGLVSTLVSSAGFLSVLLGVGLPVLVILSWLILAPITLIIGSVILHVFGRYLLRWFKGGFNDTFTGEVYATASGYSLIWIPLLGWIASGIGTPILSLITVANQNKTTWLKVLATAIIIWIVYYVVVLALAFL